MKRGAYLYRKYCLVLKGRLAIACFIISRGNASLEVSLTLGVCLTQVKSAQLLRESEVTHSQGTVTSTGLQPKRSRLHSTPQGPCQPSPELSFKGSHGTGPGPVNAAGPLTSVSPGVSLPLGALCTVMPPLPLYRMMIVKLPDSRFLRAFSLGPPTGILHLKRAPRPPAWSFF